MQRYRFLNNIIEVSACGSGVFDIYGHSLAIKSDNTLRAWGRNYNGQCGDGTNMVR